MNQHFAVPVLVKPGVIENTIGFAPKVIYQQIRADIDHILNELCKRKGMEIMGYLKGKGSLMIVEQHAN